MFALFITPAVSSPEELDPPPFNTRSDLTRRVCEVCAEYAPGPGELSAIHGAMLTPVSTRFHSARIGRIATVDRSEQGV
ncbi:hypothetical protein [Nocardia beijingensis]|uniref:hypothetical protein n=1 Tax=Nocardia beijingensis TaxID=95162 RepID=UPI0034006786